MSDLCGLLLLLYILVGTSLLRGRICEECVDCILFRSMDSSSPFLMALVIYHGHGSQTCAHNCSGFLTWFSMTCLYQEVSEPWVVLVTLIRQTQTKYLVPVVTFTSMFVECVRACVCMSAYVRVYIRGRVYVWEIVYV